MGRWDTKQKCIDDITSGYNDAHSWLVLAGVHYTDAYWDWQANNDHLAIFELIQAWSDIKNMVNNMLILNTSVTPKWAVPYCLENYTGAEVTWKTICEAWVKDDFEGRFWTIGIIDRMRQILWDEPFDLTWAARPEATNP